MQDNEIKFIDTGYFDDKMRALLQQKTKQIGVDKTIIALYLGVSSCTFLNWCQGKTSVCRIKHRKEIVEFLKGEMDNAIRELSSAIRVKSRCPSRLPEIGTVLWTLAYCYRRCARQSGKGEEYIRRMTHELNEACPILAAKLSAAGNSEAVSALLNFRSSW